MGTSLNKTTVLNLRNKSGVSVNKGDVVILDSQNAESFTVTGSAGLTTDTIGVVINPTQIVNDDSGLIAIGGYIPQINLISGASLGDTFNLASTAKYAVPHPTVISGDFGQVLNAGTTPPAFLWESPKVNVELDGWYDSPYNWTYAGNDGSTGTSYYIGNTNNLTGTYWPGMKVEITQGTVKYAFITQVSYLTGTTYLTLYGGTDYTFNATSITKLRTSVIKSPKGFPMNPDKWTVLVTDTTLRTQTSPTANIWYNLGSVKISLPIGIWDVSYRVVAQTDISPEASLNIRTTLSTANNSESDATWGTAASLPSGTIARVTFHVAGVIGITSKTLYFLNTLTASGSTGNIHNVNSTAFAGAPLVIRAVCAYL